MKIIIPCLIAVLVLASRAVACIEIDPVDGKNFATIDQPFMITFRDEGLTAEVTISYVPKPNRFGVLSTIHGDFKVEPFTGKDVLKWVISKTEKDLAGNFSVQAGKGFVKIFRINKAELDRAVFGGWFDVMGHGVRYEYALADIFRSQEKQG